LRIGIKGGKEKKKGTALGLKRETLTPNGKSYKPTRQNDRSLFRNNTTADGKRQKPEG